MSLNFKTEFLGDGLVYIVQFTDRSILFFLTQRERNVVRMRGGKLCVQTVQRKLDIWKTKIKFSNVYVPLHLYRWCKVK